MLLAYVLLYLQLDLLMTRSRIPSTESYRNRFQSEKLSKIVRIAVTIIVGIFVGLQVLLLFLSLLGLLGLVQFYIEIYVFVVIVTAAVNINQLFVYCRLVDSPYKNKKSYTNVKHLSIVCAVWTFGFAVKLISVSFQRTLYTLEI